MGRELTMNTSEFPAEMLDRFIFAVDGRRSQLFAVEKPMTQEEAVEYVGVCRRTFVALVSRGVIKAHYFKGLHTPFYFPSEIYETLKKS